MKSVKNTPAKTTTSAEKNCTSRSARNAMRNRLPVRNVHSPNGKGRQWRMEPVWIQNESGESSPAGRNENL